MAALRLDLGRSSAPVVPPQTRLAGTRKVAARLRNLEAAVQRLDANLTILAPTTAVRDTATVETLVENLASCVMHRFRPSGVVTVCGWNTGKARINGGTIATNTDVELASRPWWKLCDKCLTIEREVARLASMDDEHSMSD